MDVPRPGRPVTGKAEAYGGGKLTFVACEVALLACKAGLGDLFASDLAIGVALGVILARWRLAYWADIGGLVGGGGGRG